MVEIVNDRPAFKVSFLLTRKIFNKRFVNFLFQRDEKDSYGDEVYLWYHGTEKAWRLSRDSEFKTRKNYSGLKIQSQGKQAL